MRNCLLPGMTVEMCCLLACKLPTPCGGARLCEVYSAAARPARLEGLGRPVVRRPSDHDAFDLVDRNGVRRPIVELRRLRRRVTGDLLRVLERPPVRQTRRDPRRPEGVAAGRGRQIRRRRPPLDHGQDEAPRQRPARQPASRGVDALEERRVARWRRGSRAASAGQRARLPPANPWPASPHQHASRADVGRLRVVRVRERQDGSSTTLLLVAGGRERNYG